MSKAALKVNVTQSALSLQMKRLADLVEAPLFNRHTHGVTLTPEGKSLLTYGREILALNDRALMSLASSKRPEPIRIGIIEPAELLLTRVLPKIAKAFPKAPLQVGVGTGTELLNQLSGGVYDVVVCMGEPADPSGVVVSPMAWVGSADLQHEPRLPVVVMRDSCIYRVAAIASLEQAGRDYSIMLEAPSHFVLRAAVLAGIGVTCRSVPFMGNLPTLGELGAPLPRVAIRVHTSPVVNAVTDKVARLVRAEILAIFREFQQDQANAKGRS